MEKTCWTSKLLVHGVLPWQTYGLAFVLGVMAFKYPVSCAAALVVVYLVDSLLRERACRLPLLAFLCCAAFGFGYASQRTPKLPSSLPEWTESRKPVGVQAVAERVEPRFGNRLRVVLGNIRCTVDGHETTLPGKMALSIRHPHFIPVPGQSLKAVVRVVPVRAFGNPGGWDYGWYWQRQGVFWRAWPVSRKLLSWGDIPSDSLWQVKKTVRSQVAARVPETQGGAMVLALTTGDRSRLSSETMEATRRAGLAHTLALSGLHVGFVAAMGLWLAFCLGRLYPPVLLLIPRPKLAVLLAAPLVLGYAWLGQPSASLIRAATMFGFWGLLLLQGRGRILLDGLFFALLTLVFIAPMSAFDLSLQMSVVAVAGIGLMYPHFRVFFLSGGSWFRRTVRWVAGVLCLSLSANLALLPLVSWYFGTWCPNILLNVIWLPVLGGVVMPLGLVGLLLTCVPWTSGAGGVLLGWAAWVTDGLLAVLTSAGDAGWTPVFSVLRPLWPEMLGCAILLVVVVSVVRSSRRIPFELAALGFFLLVAPHVWVMALDTRDEARLTMVDVGLGQALVVSLPGGHRWLVDGGGGSSTFDMGEAVVAPWLAYGRPPRLDGVFLTHPDVDHSHGLPFILDRFQVKHFYFNGMMPGGLTGDRLRAVMTRQTMSPMRLEAGEKVRLTDGAVFEVVHPGAGFISAKSNEHSLVMRLVWRGKNLALLPGDVEKGGIETFLDAGHALQAEVVVLPHHGSRNSLVPRLYDVVGARVVLCSNGYLNRYGFPASEVVHAVGGEVLSTSRHGQVVCRWGERGLRVGSFYP
ncbi:DNA internalization-related competence protein ComEC/Rec2 [Pseudodesulfovibrio sp. JC047]|uniref:DNA internalization-related competence protein ComEC/Rec2 n=1 Tax=Pseudodesulfovibrio sp. JC047 TaxID=2683199 RepID=UPI0013D78E6D|nr:DNA internalization-related competence protein ComEC/Rec2 [Pseudodesulfovibrio sp. JC047]NDV19296.1 DNA internalization-related competence protein ComEC/Rec2 [Pseudodesulfovibrio sp. JC047]